MPQPDVTDSAPIAVPSASQLTESLRTKYDVAFGLDASFRNQYLKPGATDGGTLWYDLGQDAYCCASFYITPLIVNDRQLDPVGQLHSLYAEHCTPLHFERVLHHLGLLFRGHGCFAMSLYDQGVIPLEVLNRLGFRDSKDEFLFSVRGPSHVVDLFTGVNPPFFIDFS